MTSNPRADAELDSNRAAGALFDLEPLAGTTFGARLRFSEARGLAATLEALEAAPEALSDAFYRCGGLLVLPEVLAIAQDPGLLVRLSRLLGSEVENYHQTLTTKNNVHASVPEIYLVSNIPPSSTLPPPPPDPLLDEDGNFPTRFPQRRGWHTDQSFRRPPPDISLFYAVQPAPPGQGQTLFADGTAAYEALPTALKQRADGLIGVHVMPKTGRSEQAVRAGETPLSLKPHQRPQRQPVVRRHPVTGKPALYLCEGGQMDWIEGPFEGLAPGPDGEGASLLYELMTHFTQPRFTYAHEWGRGDLVIYDNRNLIHSATWFDKAANQRLMWRTTVWGNPGPAYDGETRSWIPTVGSD
nr:TauD/TfdA family dioxygenase [uncultured Brevundimonas sp.]